MSPNFNESLDDYLNKRRDNTKLSKNIFASIQGKRKKENRFFENEEKDNGPSLNFMIFSFFRKRIPSEEEEEKKEREKKTEKERAEMKDDDGIQPHTQVVEEDDYEDYEDVKHKIHTAPKEKKEGGFMSRLFGLGSKKREEPEEEEEYEKEAEPSQQQTIEELKETIKVLHKWLEKLPPEKISEFKRSPDFEKYKDGLRKLGLIKE